MNRSLLRLTLFVSLAALVLGVFLGAQGVSTKTNQNSDARKVLLELNQQAYSYYYFNTANFTAFDPPPRHNLCGYSSSDAKLAENNSIPEPCVLWNQLLDAKEHFRIMTLEARVVAPENVLTSLNNIEAGFDQVWQTAINQPYNNKWPADAYNEVMQPIINNLEMELREAFL